MYICIYTSQPRRWRRSRAAVAAPRHRTRRAARARGAPYICIIYYYMYTYIDRCIYIPASRDVCAQLSQPWQRRVAARAAQRLREGRHIYMYYILLYVYRYRQMYIYTSQPRRLRTALAAVAAPRCRTRREATARGAPTRGSPPGRGTRA